MAFSNYSNELCFVMLKNNGEILWQKKYFTDKEYNFESVKIEELKDGEIMIFSNSPYPKSSSINISKIDRDGNFNFGRSYLRGSFNYVKEVKKTRDGNLLLLAQIYDKKQKGGLFKIN